MKKDWQTRQEGRTEKRRERKKKQEGEETKGKTGRRKEGWRKNEERNKKTGRKEGWGKDEDGNKREGRKERRKEKEGKETQKGERMQRRQERKLLTSNLQNAAQLELSSVSTEHLPLFLLSSPSPFLSLQLFLLAVETKHSRHHNEGHFTNITPAFYPLT